MEKGSRRKRNKRQRVIEDIEKMRKKEGDKESVRDKKRREARKKIERNKES